MKGQGVVEFALALPVILMLVFGLIEFGRLLFVYMAVNTAARQAARYGITVGNGSTYNGAITKHYYDCAGIRAAAKSIGKYAGVQDDHITILYDHGPSGSISGFPSPPTCYWVRHWIVDHAMEPTFIEYGDRMKIQVSVPYSPLISYLFLDIPDFTMTAFANRTIVKDVKVAPGP